MDRNSEPTKWSRNLSEHNQTDSNRVRLIERQRQLLETKRQRQQQIRPTATLVDRPKSAKSVASFDKPQDKLIAEEDVLDERGISNPSLTSGEEIPTNKTGNAQCWDLNKSSNQPLKPPQTLFKEKESKDDEAKNESPFKHPKLSKEKSATLSLDSDVSDTSMARRLSDAPELNPLTTILNNSELLLFVTQPISPSKTYQCIIVRDKKGIDRSLYPTYYMHLQAIVSSESQSNPQELTAAENEKKGFQDALKRVASQTARRQIFLLGGRKRKRSKTYLIGNDPFDITRDSCIAKLKSNVIGTHFQTIRQTPDGRKCEILAVAYETNVLGFKGPRKMTVLIPKSPELFINSDTSLFEAWKTKTKLFHQLKNKTPVWNEETQSYVLNFKGRVTQASVKNFQLMLCGKQKEDDSGPTGPLSPASEHSESNDSPDSPLSPGTPPSNFAPTMPAPITNATSGHLDDGVAMQFGRVSEKEFTCDVTWPMSLLQAFAIALSSFDSKLACE